MNEEAKSAFERYNAEAGGLTWDKKPIPPWGEVGPKVRNCWRAAVNADRSSFEPLQDGGK